MQQRQTATAQVAQRQRPAMAALWLILCAIFAHALLPVDSPVSRSTGSAFSAATADVSLAPARSAAQALRAAQEVGSSAGTGGFDPPNEPAEAFPASAVPLAPTPGADPPPPADADLPRRPAEAQPYAPRAPPLS